MLVPADADAFQVTTKPLLVGLHAPMDMATNTWNMAEGGSGSYPHQDDEVCRYRTVGGVNGNFTGTTGHAGRH
eukprot:7384631-Prymnesium_polylepis.1